MSIHILFDGNLSNRPEVHQAAHETGKSRREVVCLLMEFWCWALEWAVDGFLEDVHLEMLPMVIRDTDLDFWRAVEQAGFFQDTPGGIRLRHIPEHRRLRGRRRFYNGAAAG